MRMALRAGSSGRRARHPARAPRSPVDDRHRGRRRQSGILPRRRGQRPAHERQLCGRHRLVHRPDGRHPRRGRGRLGQLGRTEYEGLSHCLAMRRLLQDRHPELGGPERRARGHRRLHLPRRGGADGSDTGPWMRHPAARAVLRRPADILAPIAPGVQGLPLVGRGRHRVACQRDATARIGRRALRVAGRAGESMLALAVAGVLP